ncbi:MAG: hypothetical protein ABSE52_07370 [Candidatus Dormibacteria bacterium]|jgi:hypothetical protein
MPAAEGAVRVVLEAGGRLTFAAALDWPGWSRSGRGDEASLEALRASALRYAPVARAAGLTPPDASRIEVVEQLRGTATTDFGAPDVIAAAERALLAEDEVDRLVRLLEACWELFDRVAAGAPLSLRKGPRGGGRDRDAVVEHVLGAEHQAAAKVGLRLPVPALDDLAGRAATRAALAGALRATAGSAPPPEGSKAWPPRYTIRRLAWHVLDHAWEIEDKSDPAPAG